jgi:hypothetical protein
LALIPKAFNFFLKPADSTDELYVKATFAPCLAKTSILFLFHDLHPVIMATLPLVISFLKWYVCVLLLENQI